MLLCATRGEAGKPGRADISGAPTDIGAARERELFDAARIAGIEHVHFLGYRDRELADAPPQEIGRKIVARLREYRPQVVFTFDPNGFNRHPDHIAISRFTMEAIAAAGDPRWFADAGPAHDVGRVLWTPPQPPWEVARSKDAAAEPGADFVIDISEWREKKAAALRAHRTQHESVEKHFFDQPDLDRILARETFRQAWGPPLSQRPSADVFEGMS